MDNVLAGEPAEINLCADCPEPIKTLRPDGCYQTHDLTNPRCAGYAPRLESHGDGMKWSVEVTVEKYEGDYSPEQIAAGLAGDPYETVRSSGNMLMNAGGQRMLDQLIGATTSPYNNTNARLGVGDSSTAEAATQTDLQAAAGSTHRQFKLMDATYPSRSGQTVTWKATFSSGEAEFAWNEWCIDRGTASGTTVTAPMLNRKVVSMGTKGAGVTWTLQVTTTLQ